MREYLLHQLQMTRAMAVELQRRGFDRGASEETRRALTIWRFIESRFNSP